MVHLKRTKQCPTCGGTDFTRYPRPFFLGLWRNSHYFICRRCRTPILLLGAAKREKAKRRRAGLAYEDS